jgi:aspartyl-tRNA(Asn)/glutamyl-tRNA(Gln) amidotransferase subunit A
MEVRAVIAAEIRGVFADGVDVLFTLTTPSPAFPLGAKTADPYEMYLSDIFTVTANLAGVPAVSLPIGRIGGLPVGGQLIAPHFGERRMLAAAYALESALGEDAHR